MATLHKTILKQILLQKSYKRSWWDITSLWRGRYKTIHVELPLNENSGSDFEDVER